MRRGDLRGRLTEALVLLVSLVATWTTWQWETDERAAMIRDDVAVSAHAIQQQFQSLVVAVEVLAPFYNASDTVRLDNFDLFAPPFLHRNPTIQILENDAWSVEQAIATLRDGASIHFDPSVIEAFESCLPRILEIKAAWDQRETLA